MPRGRTLRISRGQSVLPKEHGLITIPETKGDIVIGVPHLFKAPLYW